jgi:proteasome alpha subunit
VGTEPDDNQLFHILYDGTVMDERDYAAIGGDAEAINSRLSETWSEGLDRGAAIALGRAALAGPDREIADDDLEVADLSRTNGRRCFHRLSKSDLA